MFTFIVGVRDQIAVPISVAVCPECGAALNAQFDDFEQFQAGVDLYEPHVPMLDCRNERLCADSLQNSPGWFEAYEAVGDWMKEA